MDPHSVELSETGEMTAEEWVRFLQEKGLLPKGPNPLGKLLKTPHHGKGQRGSGRQPPAKDIRFKRNREK